jgi:hypothetical protein
MSEKEVCETYKKMINISKSMKIDVEKYRNFKKQLPFTLGSLKTEEGVNIKRAHYTKELEVEFKYNNQNYTRVALHGTSNIPEFLTDSQFTTSAITNLMKHNAKNSGSILTCGNYTFSPIKNLIKYVPN